MIEGHEGRDSVIILRTYQLVWNYPFKIYSIENIKLWVPINPWELLYFVVGVLITTLLGRVIPYYHCLPFMIQYALIPYGLMKFFTTIKLDGKLPHKFFFDYLVYAVSHKKSERFQPIRERKKMRFTSYVMYRVYGNQEGAGSIKAKSIIMSRKAKKQKNGGKANV